MSDPPYNFSAFLEPLLTSETYKNYRQQFNAIGRTHLDVKWMCLDLIHNFINSRPLYIKSGAVYEPTSIIFHMSNSVGTAYSDRPVPLYMNLNYNSAQGITNTVKITVNSVISGNPSYR